MFFCDFFRPLLSQSLPDPFVAETDNVALFGYGGNGAASRLAAGM